MADALVKIGLFIVVVVVSALLMLATEKMKGDGDIVVIEGKRYLKKVEHAGNDMYDIKYFPLEDSVKVDSIM